MKVDNFVSNTLKNYIWYISVTTRPPQVCIPGYAPDGGHKTKFKENNFREYY